jgi:hypothetical protein
MAETEASSHHCNPCHRVYLREYRKKRRLAGNPIKRTEEQQGRKRGRESVARLGDGLARRKYLAGQAVSYAVEKGRMVRPEICSRCGAGGKIQGHHRDYDKPLEVEWLCIGCHGEVHRAGL